MVTERLFRSLKSERINYRRYQTRREVMTGIIECIEQFSIKNSGIIN